MKLGEFGLYNRFNLRWHVATSRSLCPPSGEHDAYDGCPVVFITVAWKLDVIVLRLILDRVMLIKHTNQATLRADKVEITYAIGIDRAQRTSAAHLLPKCFDVDGFFAPQR